MSSVEKVGFYLLFFFLVGYYGVYALLGGDVYIRNNGWVSVEWWKSILSILIGSGVWYYIKYKEKRKK
ncbi:MAG: hypothetical protein ABXS91_08330 [Sulfurimonas sp.]